MVDQAACCGYRKRAPRSYRKRDRAYRGTETRSPITPEQRKRICRVAKAATRCVMRRRQLTHLHYQVLVSLLWTFANPRTGQCDPSIQTLARAVGCCRDTVVEALKRLEQLGILTWTQRWHRVVREGRKCVHRTSSGYRFSAPDCHKSETQSGTSKEDLSKLEKKPAQARHRPTRPSAVSAAVRALPINNQPIAGVIQPATPGPGLAAILRKWEATLASRRTACPQAQE